MENKINALKGLFESEKLDGYLVTNSVNIRYLTGFLGGSRLLIPREGTETMYVHMVNFEAAKVEAKDAEIKPVKVGEDVEKKVIDHLERLRVGRIGFDSMDAEIHLKLKEALKQVEIEPLRNLVWSLRETKDKDELMLIRRAADLTSLGMKRAQEIIKPGLREREIATEIEYAMRSSGSDGVAFDTIVASGAHSAFPHGGCGDRKIEKGDFLTIDIGAKYHDYCADLTRTVIVGKPSQKQKELYSAVLSAREAAIGCLKAGVEASAVDAAARDSIGEKGYGEYFVHGLGHGVGLEVHEPPTLNPTSKEFLRAGNVITIEPGLYFPGFGGVRIEDAFLVKKTGVEKLTEAPYVMSVG